MNPLLMAMMAAGQNPETWGPLLDALGPQFGPQQMIPGLTQAVNAPQSPFATPTQAPGAPPTPPPAPEPVPPPSVPGTPGVGMAPPGMEAPPSFTGALGAGDPLSGLLSMLSPNSPTQLAGGGNPLTTAPPPSAPPPRAPIPPQVVRPTAPQPLVHGGVTAAQKAPDMNVAMSAGGSPAQLLLQALMGGGARGGLNPLRVPTLGSLLGGA